MNINEKINNAKLEANKERIEFIQKRTLLYEYTEILAGVRQKFGKGVIGDTDSDDLDSLKAVLEKRRENALFLIRFAFKTIYGKNTLEEAIASPEVWELSKLDRLISGRYITLESVVDANDYKRHYISDKNVLLFIVYNNYDKDMTRHAYEIYEYIAKNSSGVPVRQAKAELKRLDEVMARRKKEGK